MSNANIKNFFNGIRIVPVASSGISAEGEMEVFSNSLRIYVQGAIRTVVTTDQTQTLTNKTILPSSNTLTLTSAHLLVGNGSNVATDVALSGEASILNTGAITLLNSAVIGKVLTGYVAGSGTVAATDTILQAFNKLGFTAANAVLGPASATDNAISRFDGTTGKLIQNSTFILSDNGQLTSNTSLVTGTGGDGILVAQTFTSGTGNADYSGFKSTITSSASNSIGAAYGFYSSSSITADDGAIYINYYASPGQTGTHANDFYEFYGVAPAINGQNFYGIYLEGPSSGTISGDNYPLYIASGNSYFGGQIRLKETGGGSDTITITTPAISASYTLTLPVDDGTANQALTTNGSGVLSWTTIAQSYTTLIKTTTYTAVSYDEIFANSSGGAFTITLPAGPTIGNRVKIVDYSGNWATNNVTVGRNSQNINGAAANFTLNLNNSWAEFIFVDATQGWRVIS